MSKVTRTTLANLHLEPAAGDETLTTAVLYVEVQVSRQYRFHVLHLPGASKPTWHLHLHQAIALAQLEGHDALTIVIGEAQYQLSI